jgi:hypothetical protein
VEKDGQNKTAMIGLPGQDYQDRAVKIGLSRHGCLHRTARIRQQGQKRKERTIRKRQLEKIQL